MITDNTIAEIPAQLLMELLDSGSDEGCEDTVIVDKQRFIAVQKWFENRFDIVCGEVTE